MTDNYLPPEARLVEERLLARKFGNVALAITSSAVFLPATIYSLMLITVGPQESNVMNPKFLLLNAASALVAGAFVYPFRTWPWPIAMLVAPFIGLVALIFFTLLL